MTEIQADATDPINLRALLVRLDRDRAETQKLQGETEKFVAEQRKLIAEATKLDRDRQIAPWLAIAGLVGGVTGLVGGFAGILSLLAHWPGGHG